MGVSLDSTVATDVRPSPFSLDLAHASFACACGMVDTPRYRRNGYLLGAGTITGNLVEKQVRGRSDDRTTYFGCTTSPRNTMFVFSAPVPFSPPLVYWKVRY